MVDSVSRKADKVMRLGKPAAKTHTLDKHFSAPALLAKVQHAFARKQSDMLNRRGQSGRLSDAQDQVLDPLGDKHPTEPMTKLLIVLDDDVLRTWAERVVRECGYSCDSATNAIDARELLARDSYELVLLDINMPGQSGIELISHVRSDHPNSAVVVITGEDDPRPEVTAAQFGAFGYMVKPFEAGQLLINVANALHRRALELESRRLGELESIKHAYAD